MIFADSCAAKTGAMKLKVITWNIQNGTNKGSNGWNGRKIALKHFLLLEEPDVLCVQEALSDQLMFIEGVLPGHAYAGSGRDGGGKGEHCAIFYRKGRLKLTGQNTFWLSNTPGAPGGSWDFIYERICTWAQFEDKENGRRFCVYNTHLPFFSASGREKSAGLIVRNVGGLERNQPVLLTGDFNCEPGSAPWKLFEAAGLRNTEEGRAAGRSGGTATFNMLGREMCIDGILASRQWRVLGNKIVSGLLDNVAASDHRAVVAELELGPGGEN